MDSTEADNPVKEAAPASTGSSAAVKVTQQEERDTAASPDDADAGGKPCEKKEGAESQTMREENDSVLGEPIETEQLDKITKVKILSRFLAIR